MGLFSSQPAAAAEQVAGTVCDALHIRTVSLRAEQLRPDLESGRIETQVIRLRSRFAMRFGDDRGEREQQQVRAEQVRTAFNSPFWPFVLATTSVGQEGLDFHQYCHAVVHWNLPANPVDLEQREGRVHRYKGHAIRKNLALVQKHIIGEHGMQSDPWAAMFRAARERTTTDLNPFWVLPVRNGARIERYVPALPFSRDAKQLEDLKRSLAAYRLVFGQSAQEDLVSYLASGNGHGDIQRLAAALQINLEPPSLEEKTTTPL